MALNHEGELKRSMKTRHLNMIAIGGAIGTGLFLATGYSLEQAGPGGVLVAYGVLGIMIYFLMTGLGEMSTYMPVSGSFETYATKFVDPAFGFALGWNYWFNWAITVGVELVAAGILMKYWYPDVPVVVWCFVFGALLLGLNLLSARAYGEAEYWFAGLKVVLIITFILVGLAMILGLVGGHTYGVKNYVDYGGLFPKGGWAIALIVFVAAFSFQGTELIGIAAGECEEPEKNVPKAINTVFYRILLFYMGSLFVMAAIIPWNQAGVEVSLFTLIFKKAGIPYADDIVNFVILTSALSCGNSGLYAASRMLWAMSKEGKAPKSLGKTNSRGVPVIAVLFTMIIAAFSLFSGLYAEDTVYVALLSASGLAGLIAWLGIAVSHYRFRKWYKAQGYRLEDLKYRARFYPAGPIISIIVIVFVMIGQYFDPAARLSLYLGLPLFVLLFIIYKVKYKTRLVPIVNEAAAEQAKG